MKNKVKVQVNKHHNPSGNINSVIGGDFLQGAAQGLVVYFANHLEHQLIPDEITYKKNGEGVTEVTCNKTNDNFDRVYLMKDGKLTLMQTYNHNDAQGNPTIESYMTPYELALKTNSNSLNKFNSPNASERDANGVNIVDKKNYFIKNPKHAPLKLNSDGTFDFKAGYPNGGLGLVNSAKGFRFIDANSARFPDRLRYPSLNLELFKNS